ncbi:MAG TPA: hypothetical protein VLD39_01515 [Gammaproteobacteria bacterium]|nr:hypothetical protein [Gammaproteobacteria bacterium]
MQQLVSVFVDIALHRKGPDVLPASRFLLGLVLSAYVAASFVIWQLNWPIGQAVGVMTLDVVLHLAFLAVVLAVAGRRARFLQTATAALGVETLLACAALPLHTLIATGEEGSPVVITASFLLLLVLFWSIDVAGFVLSRALEQPYIVGLVIMVGYVLGSMTLGEFLFPSPV